MRLSRRAALGAAAALGTLVACGHPGPGAQAPDAATPGDTAAQRYGLLLVNPVCPPSPGGCTAVSGSGFFQQGARGICFNVVDNGATDAGGVDITIDSVTYSALVTDVVATTTGVSFSSSFQDLNDVIHTVSVIWSFDPAGTREITFDATGSEITDDGGTVADQCDLLPPPCAL